MSMNMNMDDNMITGPGLEPEHGSAVPVVDHYHEDDLDHGDSESLWDGK